MTTAYTRAPDEHISWPPRATTIGFALIHLAPVIGFWLQVSTIDWIVCFSLYGLRMFFITAGYHRYFAHRAFKTSRVMQFVFALGGASAAQKGPLWWAAHHRHHHKYSDQPEDIHSPLRGFWWSHMGWFLCDKYKPTEHHAIRDFARFPELRWLNRYHMFVPLALAVACTAYGGFSGLVIGFCLSTVITYHCTYFINSLTHLFGRRRYVTTDTSRNSFILALLTCGEGWHNNHHHYQSTANQGFFWWEVDFSYYVLLVLSWLGLVWDLRKPPAHVLSRNLVQNADQDVGMERARLAIEASANLVGARESA